MLSAPILTDVAPVKLWPIMVIFVAVPFPPEFGAIDVIAGVVPTAMTTVNWSEGFVADVPLALVTVTSYVPTANPDCIVADIDVELFTE